MNRHASRSLGLVVAALSLLPVRSTLADEAPPAKAAELKILETPSGVRFGVWPELPQKPAPTLFILASTIEETIGQEYYRQSGNELAKRGFLCVSVDLPCHGRERRQCEPGGLDGWRFRCDHDEDFVAEIDRRLTSVLDHLIEQKWTDPERVAACGTSRGGFIALHFAAAEPRVRCVAAFAPVTDLTLLKEFQAIAPKSLAERLALEHCIPALAGRAVWLVIGDRDERVGTDSTIRLARQLTAEAIRRKRPALVDLHVVAEPRGHTTPDGSPRDAAEWIDRQIKSQ